MAPSFLILRLTVTLINVIFVMDCTKRASSLKQHKTGYDV